MKNNSDKSIAHSAIICLSISLLLTLMHFAKSDHEYADSNVFLSRPFKLNQCFNIFLFPFLTSGSLSQILVL